MPLTYGDVAAATGGRLVRGNQARRCRRDFDRLASARRAAICSSPFAATASTGTVSSPTRSPVARGGALVEETAIAAGQSVSAGEAHALICVDDTTRALQDMARDVRRRSGAKVVAITGSAGKTTTKEVAAEFSGHASPGVSEQGQLEQPHRAAAFAARAAVATRGRGGRARDESSRRDPHARRHRRT